MPEGNPLGYFIDPQLFTQRAQGMSAANELRAMPKSTQMAEALRMAGAQMPRGTGEGLAYQGPTFMNLLANMVTRGEGREKLRALDTKADVLRSMAQTGSEAELQQQELERQQEMDFKRELAYIAAYRQAMADDAREVLKPPANAQKNYAESNRLLGVANDLDTLYEGMPKSAKNQVDSPLVSAGMSMLPNAVQRIAESKYYTEPAARQYLTRGARFESKLSQLMAGLNVTGYEMSDRQKWSPFAPGVEQSERQIRLDNIKKDLAGELEQYGKLYPRYTFEALGTGQSSAAIEGPKPEKSRSVLDITPGDLDSMSLEELQTLEQQLMGE